MCLRVFLFIALASVLSISSGRAGLPLREQGGQPEADTLMQLDKDFDEATARKGVEGWVMYFAENGSMVSGTAAPTTGRDAIRKAMSGLFGDSTFSLRWTPTSAGIFIPGKLGYTVGRSEQRGKDKEGRRVIKRGVYTTLWMKQGDGSWKIIFDTGSSDGPPVPAD